MRRSGWRIVVLAAAALMSAGLAAAAADDRTMLERGRTIAEGRCGPCHATGLDDESPHRITPPLRVLHERYPIEMLQRAAETGVVDGHDEMPMFRFSMPDTQALLAYIDSLAPDKPGYASGSGTTPK